MKIISLVNSKGGVGKTTLATNLGQYLHIRNSLKDGLNKILLVDADPQGSLRDWNQAGCQIDLDVFVMDTKHLLMRLPAMLKDHTYDYVIIDTPGKSGDITAAAIAISDVCLIPVQPSPYDLWASNDVIDLIQTRQTVSNGKPLAFYVLNRCIPNANISRDVMSHIKESSLTLLGIPIHQRVVYPETAKAGKTVFDSSIQIAQSEISNLGEHLINMIGEDF